jgi:ribosomal protein S1
MLMDNQLDNGHGILLEKGETTYNNETSPAEKSENLERMDSIEGYEKSFQSIQRNDYLLGKVVKVENEGVYVDIGWKREGFIPMNQLSHRPISQPGEEVKVGDEIPVIVLKVDDMEGELILSKKRADLETAWRRVVQAYENAEVLTATVVESVKGGLLVDLGLRGFVPASQVDVRPVKDLDEFVGDALRLKVIELDPSRRKVVLSRKKVLEEERLRMKENTLDTLYEGQIIKGTIARLTNFGAFVNLGGVDGLVHISEMAWKRIKHPAEVIKVGQPIDVMVLKVDKKRERISLSIRQAMPDPWLTVDETVGVNNVVKGTITKIAKKYVFVEVLDGVEGVIPMHEISDDKSVKPEDLLKEGQEAEIRVLEIKKEARRMVLSLRQARKDSTSKKDISNYLSSSGSSSSSGSGATIGDILRAKFRAAEQEDKKVEEKKPVVEEQPTVKEVVSEPASGIEIDLDKSHTIEPPVKEDKIHSIERIPLDTFETEDEVVIPVNELDSDESLFIEEEVIKP